MPTLPESSSSSMDNWLLALIFLFPPVAAFIVCSYLKHPNTRLAGLIPFRATNFVEAELSTNPTKRQGEVVVDGRDSERHRGQTASPQGDEA